MIIHRVVQGDTLYSLSKKYDLPIRQIIIQNGLNKDETLVVGQELIFQYPNETYTVKNGDSLYSIADENNVTINELFRNNPQLKGNPLIYPDMTLTLSYFENKEGNSIINGYAYPFISDEVLRKTLPFLTYITVFTYGFTENGELIEADDSEILQLASSYGIGAILLISTLTEDGTFNNTLSRRLFLNEELQSTIISKLISTAKLKGYKGIEVDFEYINKEDKEAYVRFLSRLSDEMAGEGLILFVALAPKYEDDQVGLLYEGHDYAGIGNVADYVILMTYEWGYQYGPPGAVAPINKVEEVVQYAVSRISTDKILLGIPNYGYNWALPFIKGQSMAEGISNVNAVNLARETMSSIRFDDTAMSPFFKYKDNSVEHEVWFENAESISAKTELILKYNLRGGSIWNIMRYFPQLYGVLNSLTDIVDTDI